MSVASDDLSAYATDTGKNFFAGDNEATVQKAVTNLHSVTAIREMFSLAREERRPVLDQWHTNYTFLYNKYWNREYRPDWRAAAEVPEISPIISARVGWMTDQRPEFTVSMTAEHAGERAVFYDQLADHLELLLNSSYYVNFEEAEIRKSLFDAHVYGTGFIKTVWNPSLADGLGDAQITRVSPYAIYPDPQATCLEDADWIIEVKQMSLAAIDRKFPGAAEKLGGSGPEDIDEQQTQTAQNRRRANPAMGNPGAMSTPGSRNYGMSSKTWDPAMFHHQGVTVFETWTREHEIVDVPAADNKTRKSVREHWRVVVMANDVILMDKRADQLWSHRGHPYERIVLEDLGEFWGKSLVELLISGQELLNKLLVAVVQNIDLVGNPILLEPKESGLPRTKKTNMPGQALTANTQALQHIRWLVPPPLHQAIPEMLRYIQERLENISGLQAIAKGANPGGRPSEGSMDTMQEASMVRVRMAQRELEKAMQGAGRKKASLIIDNYTSPRYQAVIGNDGERTHLTLRARHFQAATDEGAAPLALQVKVDAGSQRATSREAQLSRAERFHAIGAVDDYELLKAADWPKAKEVADRVAQARQAQAMAEATQKDKSRR